MRFTPLGEDKRATISYCIVSSTKPNLLQSMCSVCCTTSWICAPRRSPNAGALLRYLYPLKSRLECPNRLNDLISTSFQ